MKRFSRGMTLPELIIALGILTILFGMTTITLLRSTRISQTEVLVDTVIADLRDQQNKAMAQNTGGDSANSDYGVHLETNSYTLFKGDTYSASDPNNFKVELDPGLSFNSVTLPDSSIVFESGSGNIVGYSAGSDSFVVEDETGSKSVNVTMNRYGVPIE